MSKPNIILISLDSLRADHLSCYGYQRKTTPNIDKIAGNGVIFKNAYSGATWTAPSHATLLTGLYPSQHHVIHENSLDSGIPSIAEILQKNGYRTGGFINNPAVGNLTGLAKGHEDCFEIWRGFNSKSFFDKGVKYLKWKSTKMLDRDQGAANTNRLITKWIKERQNDQQPFYLFIHYSDIHNPFKARFPFRRKFLEVGKRNIDKEKMRRVINNPLVCLTDKLELNFHEIEMLKSLYDAEILYLDHKVGELIDNLTALSTMDNTVLIITADHGEHFGEKGLFSHVSSLYEPIIHVPLILWYPKVLAYSSEIAGLVHLIDVFPTILHLSQVEWAENNLPGTSLVPLRNEENYHEFLLSEWEGRVPHFVRNRLSQLNRKDNLALFSQKKTVLRKGSLKLIHNSQEPDELYNIEQDPEEKTNLAKNSSKIYKELKQILHDWQNQNHVKTDAESDNYTLDPQIKRTLKALGYL